MTSATIVDDELLIREPRAASTSTTSYGDTKVLAKGVALVTCADPAILTDELADIVNSVHANCTIGNLSVCPVSAIAFMGVSGSGDAESANSYASNDIKAKKPLMAPIVEWVLDVSNAPIPARL
ncbi:hypothetical protein [Paraburkholderia fungorum]|uniref:hypothetical protein n=1 Tax=Paraburkholderia fungorum TaxID=134537 RepID=UPI00248EDD9B|nr:hypothetical protein [Paraburkholderia fungorum]